MGQSDILEQLQRFKTEVTDKGPEACLPRELSDPWLDELIRSTEAMLGSDTGEADGALALAAVLCILESKIDKGGTATYGEQELARALGSYQIELSLELMDRNSDIRYEAATLRTIFTDRDVVTWRDDERRNAENGRRSDES